VKRVTDRVSNPFGVRAPGEPAVYGYGDANADFHVVGDRPGVHGGADAGVPFTGEPWSATFLSALVEGGLIADFDEGSVTENGEPPDPIRADGTFFSYLHTCVVDGVPDEASYDDMERFFDAELRAIAAHVLIPVGARAIRRVLDQYTAQGSRYESAAELEALHAEELHGSGFLVLPMKDPGDWIEDDEQAIVTALETTLERDYRQLSDLGRFLATDDPYLVR